MKTEKGKRSETIQRYAEVLGLIIAKWSDDERLELLSHVNSRFCRHCGKDMDKEGFCHYWNDD